MKASARIFFFIFLFSLSLQAHNSPGVELLAVRKRADVVVPDIVALLDGARALLRHESLLYDDVVERNRGRVTGGQGHQHRQVGERQHAPGHTCRTMDEREHDRDATYACVGVRECACVCVDGPSLLFSCTVRFLYSDLDQKSCPSRPHCWNAKADEASQISGVATDFKLQTSKQRADFV